jgi:hypothetical protein
LLNSTSATVVIAERHTRRTVGDRTASRQAAGAVTVSAVRRKRRNRFVALIAIALHLAQNALFAPELGS